MSDQSMPRPWREYGSGYTSIKDAEGNTVALAPIKQARSLIVRAVNSHDALLAACEAVMDYSFAHEPEYDFADVMKQVKAAVALAESEDG